MSALTIQLTGLPPVTHVLKDDTITIGRMKGNTIVIADDSVSLVHAKITRVNGRFFLKDLNSTNGTLVNGQTISEAPLHNQDRVRFAEVVAEFMEEAADTASAPPMPAKPAVPIASTAAPAAPAKPAAIPAPVLKPKRSVALVPVLTAGALALVATAFIVWKSLHPAVASALSTKADAADLQSDLKTLTIADCINTLKTDDVIARRKAARALNSLGADAKPALPELHAALQDADAEVRIWSALALIDNKSYDKAIVPILVQALRHDDALLRQVSCLSLAVIPCEDAEKETIVPALAETAGRDTDADVRKAAVSALKILAPDLVGREASK